MPRCRGRVKRSLPSASSTADDPKYLDELSGSEKGTGGQASDESVVRHRRGSFSVTTKSLPPPKGSLFIHRNKPEFECFLALNLLRLPTSQLAVMARYGPKTSFYAPPPSRSALKKGSLKGAAAEGAPAVEQPSAMAQQWCSWWMQPCWADGDGRWCVWMAGSAARFMDVDGLGGGWQSGQGIGRWMASLSVMIIGSVGC